MKWQPGLRHTLAMRKQGHRPQRRHLQEPPTSATDAFVIGDGYDAGSTRRPLWHDL